VSESGWGRGVFPWWKFGMCLHCNVQAAYCACERPVVVQGAAAASHILTVHALTSDPVSEQQMAELSAAAATAGVSVERTGGGCTFTLGVDRDRWCEESMTKVKLWAEALLMAAGVDYPHVTSMGLVSQQSYWETRDATKPEPEFEDEFEPALRERLQDPEFRRAYEAAERGSWWSRWALRAWGEIAWALRGAAGVAAFFAALGRRVFGGRRGDRDG
jgi:hypothetical protein